ncbi:hypothetical protein Bbelb_330870 [Branchiostoma belcheri]|nr:hypothetical protein Bbelb_330870 [Branchiostoma belcheri]
MPQISTTDNPVEATHHMVVNDRSQGSVPAANEFGFAVKPHPSNSPDLAPSDVHLFPKLKFHLRGQRFDGNDDVIYAVEANLGGPDATFFHNGKINLEHHWTKCIAVGED